VVQRGIGFRIRKLVATVTFAAMIVVAAVESIFLLNRTLDDRLLGAEATAFALASSAADSVAENNAEKARKALTAVARIPTVLMASIQTIDGNTLASMGQGTYLASDMMTAADGKLDMLFKGQMPVAVDIVKAGEVRGRLTMVSDISAIRTAVLVAIGITLATTILAATLSISASLPLQRRIVGPLTRLTFAIEAIRKSRDYKSSVEDEHQNDETGILVKAFNGLMSDIRFRDQALQRLAYFDPLTGLPNRVSFLKQLEAWQAENAAAASGAVLLLEVHSFRSFVQAFGEITGDAIMMSLAAQIKAAIPDSAIIARHDGHEFAVFLPDASARSRVQDVIKSIHAPLDNPLQIGSLHVHVVLTAGATLLAENQEQKVAADELLRQANLALTSAQSKAAGQLEFYENALADQVEKETALGQALRQALHENAFSLHYQPQLDLRNNTIIGFEALLRWKDAHFGQVSPGVFVPLAEKMGLMPALGDWVLNEGCRQAAQWRAEGKTGFTVSVNVSAAQILASHFVERVRAALQASGLAPHMLCLEITESIFAGAHFGETAVIFETLTKDGVKLALDDFGTGYSSLSYLQRLPFHFLKIDRSFVAGADKNKRKLTLLASIVQMAKGLGIEVVAEGAETEGEFATLRDMGAEKLQGYIVAKPMIAEEAMNFAERQNQRIATQIVA
jgi:diguanylate cyclase (GGDEF)-like protein